MRRTLARIRRHLHWWSAALVFATFAIAWIMTALPLSMLLIKFLLYQAHKSVGLVVLALTVTRLALLWAGGTTPGGTRAVLLAMLVVVPTLGYVTAAASPTDVPTLFFMLVRVPHAIAPNEAMFDVARPTHMWLAIALIGLAVWHGVEMGRARARSARRLANRVGVPMRRGV